MIWKSDAMSGYEHSSGRLSVLLIVRLIRSLVKDGALIAAAIDRMHMKAIDAVHPNGSN